MKKTIFTAIIMLLTVGASAQKEQKWMPVKDTNYVLKGKITDFQLLYKAVTQPRDVTPNQQEALSKWIEGIKPEKEQPDSINNK